MWGTATSAYQIEGGNKNDWETQTRLAPAGRACDHYNRFVEDFSLAKKLRQNAHRLSLEWSRIEPDEGQWNEPELEHYFHVLDFLKEKGFKTFLTLHHFTNPVWFAKDGGWANSKSAVRFAAFTEKVISHLGELVDFWVTVNEPNIYANLSYLRGIWPPFERSSRLTYKVYRNLLAAHNRAYQLIHGYYPDARVGFAQNISYNEPFDAKSLLDKWLVEFSNWSNIDFAYERTQNDFLGLNHYSRNIRKFGYFPRARSVRQDHIELTDKGWEIYPQGLFDVLIKLKKFKKPIYILENGLADVADDKRAKFISDYLQAVFRAIRQRVDIRGYFYWTLLDSYEWPVLVSEKTGYEMKFGLVEVDFGGDLKRKVRKSARVYAKICKENEINISPSPGLRPPSPARRERG